MEIIEIKILAKVTVARGYPQGCILLQLLWTLLVDEVIVNLNKDGF